MKLEIAEIKFDGSEIKFNLSSLSAITDYLKNFYMGKVSVSQLCQAWESLLNNKANVLEELSKLKKDEIINKYYNIYGADRYKKTDLVKYAFERFFDHFVMSDGLCYMLGTSKEEAVEKQLCKWTTEIINKRIEDNKEKLERNKHRFEQFRKSLTNPETLEEFEEFIQHRTIEKLTLEQLRVYEELKTISNRAKSNETKIATLSIDADKIILPEGTKLNLQHTFHTKDNYDLWVVSLSQRVEKDLYNQLNILAKVNEGYYSSYTRDGAIAGWQFKEKEQAESFFNLESVDGKERLEKINNTRQTKAIAHINELIESIRSQAQSVIDSNRLTNTARRVKIANSMESTAYRDLQLTHTMENIANALSEKDLKFIDRLFFKVDFELLELILREAKYERFRKLNLSYSEYSEQEPCLDDVDCAVFPKLRVYGSSLHSVASCFLNTTGLKRTATKFNKFALSTVRQGEWGYVDIDSWLYEEYEDFISKIKAKRNPSIKYTLEIITEPLNKIQQLKRLGLETLEDLKVGLREYLNYRGKQIQTNPIVLMRRELVSIRSYLKEIEYFPTPRHIVDKMLEHGDIQQRIQNAKDNNQQLSILDPSAGTGHILEVVRDHYSDNISFSAIEQSPRLCRILESLNFSTLEGDFLELEIAQRFDCIVANPPFSKQINHVYRMYELLKPGGILISIVSESVAGNGFRSGKPMNPEGEVCFFNNNRTSYSEFRGWLGVVNADVHTLPDNSFLQSDNPTTVKTRIIVIRK